MNLAAINAVLLFALSIPVVMKYRILPVTGTPYWLFGILFAILTANVIISLCRPKLEKLKSFFMWSAIVIVIGGVTVTAIMDRSKTAPVFGVHDIIIQQEAAMRFLIEGKNPYKETYFQTPLAAWPYDELGQTAVNPALYHFVMPPWYLLFPFAFYFVSLPILGYFDGRIPLLFLLFATLSVLSRWFKSKDIGRLAVILTALSPAVLDFFIEGRSDGFVLFWLVAAFCLLEKRKLTLSAIMFGLAIVSKQTSWFALPFYFYYFWILEKKDIIRSLIVFLVTIVMVAGPFLLWDAGAFIESTISYLSGTAPHSYPIFGYGLGMLLYSSGLIKDTHAYYPFVLWQAIFGIPVALLVMRWILRKPLMSRLLIGYAVTLAVIWYFSRYLNNSHLGYLSSIFIIGVLKDIDEK